MVIPGVPDDQLERLHLYLGPGKGSTYAYKHLPSGITVCAAKPPQVKVHLFHQQLIAELTAKLRAAGVLKGTEAGSE